MKLTIFWYKVTCFHEIYSCVNKLTIFQPVLIGYVFTFIKLLINADVHTAVCRIMFDLHFYSSKTPILRVIGGAEGVVPRPHNGGSK